MERKQCIYAADAMLELTFYFTIFMQDLSIFRVLFLREGIIKKKNFLPILSKTKFFSRSYDL